ncbi:hypothetical protein Tco_1408947 [Tanacetum coccineum]
MVTRLLKVVKLSLNHQVPRKGNSQKKDTQFGISSQPNEGQTQPIDGGSQSQNVAPNGGSQSRNVATRKKLVPKRKNKIAAKKQGKD